MNPSTRALLDRVVVRLAGMGISAQPIASYGGDPSQVSGDLLELRRGHSYQVYAVRVGKATGLADYMATARHSSEPVLVIDEHLGPRTAEVLRRTEFAYVDASGNAWLEFGDVLIDIRGRKRLTPPPLRAGMENSGGPRSGAAHTARAGNLFSAARSRVVFAVLAWPVLWGAATREIAQCAGVSLGLAHETLTMLRESGYDRPNLATDHRLLDLWAASFPHGLARKIHLRDFRADLDRELVPDVQPVFLGGESAIADLVRPTTVTLYVAKLTPALIAANRWRTDGPPNVTAREVFWNTPDPRGADAQEAGPRDRGDQSTGSHSVYPARFGDIEAAPWPLVYADLFTSDDPRLRSAADAWRSRFV